MTDRIRSSSYPNSNSGIMANELSPRKTMFILVIVVGCFAVLWPKVFYPMIVGSINHHVKPSPIDKTAGCCDVISDMDVDTIRIMSEVCSTIIKKEGEEDAPLTGREIIARCRSAVLETCGIDISAVLQQQVRLGHTTKQILDQVRSMNGSLCLKYNFGVAPWKLGVPHTVKVAPSSSVRQERSSHLRSEMVHPAFKERGRAIPQTTTASPSRFVAAKRVVEGRPGPIPAMRPAMGGPGHVVPPSKQGTGSIGLLMPIYTIGIVIFFTYTVMKIIFKKQPESLYPPVDPDSHFRKEVFESERCLRANRDGVSSKLGDVELDQLRKRLRETELAMERIVEQMAKVPLKLQDAMANGKVVHQEEPSVKVMGMEMRASCEGGQKWSRPESPVEPHPADRKPVEPEQPPQEIILEGSLPPQSHHLLVSDSATEAEKSSSEEDPAVVLAGKMTLSVISLDSSDNGTDESSNSGQKNDRRSSSNISDDFEKIEVDQIDIDDTQPLNILEGIKKEISQIEGEDIDIVAEKIRDIAEASKEFIAEERDVVASKLAEVVDSTVVGQKGALDFQQVQVSPGDSKQFVVEEKDAPALQQASEEYFVEVKDAPNAQVALEEYFVEEKDSPAMQQASEEYFAEEKDMPTAQVASKEYFVEEKDSPAMQQASEEYFVEEKNTPALQQASEEYFVEEKDMPATQVASEEYFVEEKDIPAMQQASEEYFVEEKASPTLQEATLLGETSKEHELLPGPSKKYDVGEYFVEEKVTPAMQQAFEEYFVEEKKSPTLQLAKVLDETSIEHRVLPGPSKEYGVEEKDASTSSDASKKFIVLEKEAVTLQRSDVVDIGDNDTRSESDKNAHKTEADEAKSTSEGYADGSSRLLRALSGESDEGDSSGVETSDKDEAESKQKSEVAVTSKPEEEDGEESEEEEEVEYEYEEESDEADEVAEGRSNNRTEEVALDGRLNGDNQRNANDAAIGENDVSDEEEEDLEEEEEEDDADEIIQEIIEYVTDEEDDPEPNSLNHVNNGDPTID